MNESLSGKVGRASACRADSSAPAESGVTFNGAARRTARVAACVIGLCVVVLLVDYAVARTRKPVDAKRISDLQEQVKAKASLAPVLAAAHDSITQARRARKLRTNILAWLLLAASAAFVFANRRLIAMEGVKAVSLPAIREMKSPPTRTHRKKRRAMEQRAASSEISLEAVDEIVQREGRGKEAAIPILQAIQEHYRYLPEEALRRVCELTEITPAQIAGTSTFYSRFRRSPVGEHMVHVCHGTACHVSGARQISEELRRHLQVPDGGDTDPNRQFTLEDVACLGCCSLAPVLMVDDHTAGKLTPSSACEALETAQEKELS